MIPLWKGKNPIYFGVIRPKVKVTVTINRVFDNRVVSDKQRTDNTMTKRKSTKGQNDPQNIKLKIEFSNSIIRTDLFGSFVFFFIKSNV